MPGLQLRTSAIIVMAAALAAVSVAAATVGLLVPYWKACDDRAAIAQAVVEAAIRESERLDRQAATGAFSRRAALLSLRSAVAEGRFDGGRGTLAVYDMHGLPVAGSGRSDLTGVNMPAVAEWLRAVRRFGSTVTEVRDVAPASGQAIDSIAVARAFPAWNVFMVSTVRIDDVESAFRDRILTLGGAAGGAALTVLLAVAAVITARRAERPAGRAGRGPSLTGG